MEQKKKVSFREFIKSVNILDTDIDVSVDNTECYIAYCSGSGKLTPDGEKEFGECLDKLVMSGSCVTSDNQADYDAYDEWLEDEKGDGGLLRQAERFLYAAAGYCSCDDYDKWFEN